MLNSTLPAQVQSHQHSWWVEVHTPMPEWTHCYGPFDHLQEARIARTGYVENLRKEGARDIVAVVKQHDVY
jgi:Domain of unknown function (DUF1816)